MNFYASFNVLRSKYIVYRLVKIQKNFDSIDPVSQRYVWCRGFPRRSWWLACSSQMTHLFLFTLVNLSYLEMCSIHLAERCTCRGVCIPKPGDILL